MTEESPGDPIQAVADKMRTQMHMVQMNSTKRVTMTTQQAAMRLTKKAGGKAVVVRRLAKRVLR